MNKSTQIPVFKSLGIGIGLRPTHYETIFKENPPIDWFEIISENYMIDGGKPIEHLEMILERYPVVQHGVSMAIGSPDPLDFDYLKRLKKLAQKTKTPWISDHLCWGQMEGAHFHDLLPLPYTEEVVRRVVEKARIVQDFLEIPFALENLSSYVAFTDDQMPEWEFYSTIVEQANIFMMLDINNIYVSSRNHGFDPQDYINHVPLDRVIQMHLAGHTDLGTHCIDTHDNFVKEEVWKLYGQIWPKTKRASTLLEWDDNIPEFDIVWKEALKAEQYQQSLVCSR